MWDKRNKWLQKVDINVGGQFPERWSVKIGELFNYASEDIFKCYSKKKVRKNSKMQHRNTRIQKL